MSLKVWFDGQLVDKEKAIVSVYDHGLLYGDGVFEGIRAYSGRVFELDAHVRRLFDCAKAIRLNCPYSPEQIKAAINETVSANGFTDCYIRPVISRGPGDLGIDPRKAPRPLTFIIADQIVMYPKEMYEKGIAVVTSSWTRNLINATSTRIKSLNYLNNIMAKQEAGDAGAHDALVLNHLGHVSELSAANVFTVRDGVITTPPLIDGCLEGVTRNAIMKLAGKAGIRCVEQSISRFDVYVADEFFATGTGVEVIPITQVDQRQIGAGQAGPITRRLVEAFHNHVREG
ncbi:MAG TPA: branched-chain-amino-acid transaminase [Tepidisphaeraceae bacterium]|nr:branched-chain-amino-acid transaminase [Tepidisphaeraceae bacterium]